MRASPPPRNRPRPTQASAGSALPSLLTLLSGGKRTIVLACLSGCLAGIGGAHLLAMVNHAIEAQAADNQVMRFVIVLILTLAAGLASQFLLINISQKSVCELRVRLTRGILGTELRHIETLGGHRLLATLTNDVRSISQTMTVIPGLLVDSVTIVACFAYLAWLSGFAFALMTLALLLCFWGVKLASGKARHLFAVAREEEDTLIGLFRTATDGIKELKLNGQRRAQFLDHDLKGSASSLKYLQMRAMRLFAVTDVLSQLTLFVILGLVVMVLPRFLTVTPSLIASFALTIMFLTVPFQNLLHRLPELVRGAVAIRKLNGMKLELLEHEEPSIRPELSQNAHNSGLLKRSSCAAESECRHELDEPDAVGRGIAGNDANGCHEKATCLVELDRVVYGYEDEGGGRGFSLGPVSMRLQPGQITYLTGGNGSGKSTVAKLISGLYTPQSGVIRLNGQVISLLEREWYRQHFSAVFDDFHLFEQCLDLDGSSRDEEVRQYLQALELSDKVSVEGGRLSTIRLSQGQRKRIALLAAYLEDRPFYLFDEWAADQEPGFRETFYHHILPNLREQEKTILVITHDDRYFHLADQLLKLDYGEVELEKMSVAV